jgi:CubicO group peptidase (beta-lactamase class C family)
MTLRSLLAAAVTGAMALGASAAGAQPEDVGLGAAVSSLQTAGFSGLVAAGDADGVYFERAVGYADRERRRPHRLSDRWPWASVSKQVTAALVMQQVDRGRLKLDAPIRSVLPDFEGPSGDRVTIRQLLQHTSGLPNPDETAPAPDGVPSFYKEQGRVIADRARTHGYCAGAARAEPGAGFSYNNCDFNVLGAVLEQVTGKSYAAVLRDGLVHPLGLRSLRPAPDGAPGGGSDVVGYENGVRAPFMNFAALGAGGALVGTARDMLAFDRALLSKALVSPGSYAEMWRGDPKLGYAALGAWSFSAPLRGCAGPVTLVERRGHFGGVQVRNVVAPELGRAVAAFTNNGDLEFGEIWQGRGPTFELASAAFCRPRGG